MSAISCQQRQFGTLETGQAITSYSLRNASGMAVHILNYGAVLSSIQLPDIRGEMHEVTLGPCHLAHLEKNAPLSGAVVTHLPARYGITLDTAQRVIWEAENTKQDKAASVKLSLKGTTGLKYSASPLDYQLTVEYTLTDANELVIRSKVQSSIPLLVFTTHQPYWNLTGMERSHINEHILQVWASRYANLNEEGFLQSDYLDIEENSAFNFQKPQRIDEKRAQISEAMNYNVCFKLDEQEDSAMPLVARVKAPVSGRTLEVYTTQEGLHFSLKSNPQSTEEGFCLTPTPLVKPNAHTDSDNSIKQETLYKLVW